MKTRLKTIAMMAVLACVALPQAGAEETAADGYNFSREWKSEEVPITVELPEGEQWSYNREGFGHDNQFFIHDQKQKKIHIYGQNGFVADFAVDGGQGCNFTRDEAGNFLLRLPNHIRPYSYTQNEIRIVKADGSTYKDFKLPKTRPQARGDFWGFAEGDVFSAEGGKLVFVAANVEFLYVVEFKSGELTEGYQVAMPFMMGPAADKPFSGEDYVSSWTDVNGQKHFLIVQRTENPVDVVLNGHEVATATTINTHAYPGFGTSNGVNCFAMNGKNYILFTTRPNWNDGFVVAELGTNADGSLDGTVNVVATHTADYETAIPVTASPQCNWLRAEPKDEKSVYVYQYFPGYYMARYIFSVAGTPLEWIVNEGTVGETYTVADDLVGVYVAEKDPTRVYAKDLGKYRDKAIRYEHQHDYVERCGLQTEEWDQSNWVLLGFETEAVARKFVGKLIKGGTLTGTLTDQLNPTMTVTAYEVPTEEQAYAENHYVTCNFMTPNVQTVADGEFFFMTPKPQEYCKVHWATFEGHDVNHFTVEKTVDGQTMGNEHGLAGGFPVDWSLYPGNPAEDFIAGNTYDFHVIVRWVSNGGSTSAAPRRAEGVPSEGRYMVFPLEGGDGLVTAVTAPRAEVHPVGVTYVNVMGMMSSKPFPGLNIEVTHYSDGTTSSEKRMIK
ncbi:MAG: hypothetical protein J6I72_07995 [Muribaculaceae bacterium]|nr:hypothetical protein [Muribaculaceae bacterium]